MVQIAKKQQLLQRMERLNAIGIALSAEHDSQRLLEMILQSAREITGADGGTLYTVTEDKHLKFEIMHNLSLRLFLGGTTGNPIPYAPLPLYRQDGSPNLNMVAAYAVIKDCTVNIQDAYQEAGFDFTGTREFDQKTGYRSKSFLTVPMKDHSQETIGVLQLINAADPMTGEITAFTQEDQQLVESLASQAAIAMSNRNLIDGLRKLFESFIQLIADAIDEKSPHTGGHCRRVPELTMMLADAAIKTREGPLKAFTLNDKEIYELKIAAWLHDCGKVTTPEAVMDKPTKLSTIYDRIELIAQRFVLLKSQAEVDMLHQKLAAMECGQTVPTDLEKQFLEQCAHWDDCLTFLRSINVGAETMSEEDRQKVLEIAKFQLRDLCGEPKPFLSRDEVYNLTIPRGTLTPEERAVINNHITVTINMLEALPYPKELKRVPEYAGGHHERMDGKGYPRGLTREQMSIPARVMGIADIFEALTAKDRPYKKAKTLSESLHILGNMKLSQHVDPDLFDVFIREKVYLRYAERFLEPEQLDEVDEAAIPGYQP